MDAETSRSRERPRQILLVEDDEEIRESICELIQGEGKFEVVAVGNGLEALHHLRHSRPPDLILLDLMMPVMDGWQFRLAQKSDPGLAATPVLAMSADSSAKAAAIDADMYLSKPLHAQELLEAIDETLSMFNKKKRAAERAQADRLASLGTLAAGIAHEINNPLTYLLANLQLLERRLAGKTDDKTLSMIDDALEGAGRIREIVHDIKTFSRVEGESLGPVDVNRVLEAALKMMGNEIKHRAQLTRSFEPLPHVFANEGRLGQVCLNLLINAVQAIPEGNATQNSLRVTTRTEESSHGPRAVIEVRDSGAGIPARILSRIFEPFFTTKPVGIGTGLGLSIRHGIVTSLGGEITVASEVGRGTTFRVSLPGLARAQTAQPFTPHLPVPAVASRVLVIDDEPGVVNAITNLLSDHTLVTASSGQQALDILARDADFDIILCDIHMPDVTGVDIYEQQAAARTGLERRIVFMTGGAFTPRAREFLSRSKARCLEKPFDADTLLALVTGAGRAVK